MQDSLQRPRNEGSVGDYQQVLSLFRNPNGDMQRNDSFKDQN